MTDGSHNETASLNKIDPVTFEVTRLLNNLYGVPFQGLNDIEVDADGNFWITDDHYGWVSEHVSRLNAATDLCL